MPWKSQPQTPQSMCITDSNPLLPTCLGLLPQTPAVTLSSPDATLTLLVILVWGQYEKQEGVVTECHPPLRQQYTSQCRKILSLRGLSPQSSGQFIEQ